MESLSCYQAPCDAGCVGRGSDWASDRYADERSEGCHRRGVHPKSTTRARY